MCALILMDGADIADVFKGMPATIVLIIYVILFGFFIIGMLCFHTYLSLINTTTFEALAC
jgi:hypothetical protein